MLTSHFLLPLFINWKLSQLINDLGLLQFDLTYYLSGLVFFSITVLLLQGVQYNTVQKTQLLRMLKIQYIAELKSSEFKTSEL